MKWFGIDIGGANIKCFDPHAAQLDQAFNASFPMWKSPDRLESTLAEIVSTLQTKQPIAATMTGELADCFQSKKEGVRFIADALVRAAGARDVYFYSISGSFETLSSVHLQPDQFAATNWLATAIFAGRFFDQRQGCLVDVGSTTTDIIPLQDKVVDLERVGATDFERLKRRTLVYAGVKRTPLCGLVDECESIEVANELFATTLDAYLVLGQVENDDQSTNTADGRPANVDAARQRLARMFCSDVGEIEGSLIDSLATLADTRLTQRIREAICLNVPLHDETQFVVAGEGDWKAAEILKIISPDCTPIRMSDKLGPKQSECAPAVAVSTLATECMPR